MPFFNRLLHNASPFSVIFAEGSFFQPFLFGKPPWSPLSLSRSSPLSLWPWSELPAFVFRGDDSSQQASRRACFGICSLGLDHRGHRSSSSAAVSLCCSLVHCLIGALAHYCIGTFLHGLISSLVFSTFMAFASYVKHHMYPSYFVVLHPPLSNRVDHRKIFSYRRIFS